MEKARTETGFVADEMVRKLLILFIFEKMDIALTDSTLSEIIMSNNWMPYMYYRESFAKLQDAGFIYCDAHGAEPAYQLTREGRECLTELYLKIPASLREEVLAYIKENKVRFRKNQEYRYDLSQNRDGTWTVDMFIKEGVKYNLLEVSVKVPTRTDAVRAGGLWKQKAPQIFETIWGTLVEPEENPEK
ncbi:MAG: DUF4364 family protein [Christensenellaceae bacterium]|jgi:predicted transcriptional regulator|nr:DUF4364 family protein [Christensenellaceae bacterium]